MTDRLPKEVSGSNESGSELGSSNLDQVDVAGVSAVPVSQIGTSRLRPLKLKLQPKRICNRLPLYALEIITFCSVCLFVPYKWRRIQHKQPEHREESLESLDFV